MTKTKVMEYHSKKKPKMREPSRAFDAKFKRIARFNNPKVKPEKMHVIPKTANYSYSNQMKVGIKKDEVR